MNDVVVSIAIVAVTLLVFAVAYLIADRVYQRRDRKYEARLSASHRALAEVMAQRPEVEQVVAEIHQRHGQLKRDGVL